MCFYFKLISGIQKHILLTAGLVTAFTYAQKHRDNYFAEKDAILRHYLELHPDEFEEPRKFCFMIYLYS